MSACVVQAVCYTLVFLFPVLYVVSNPTLDDVLRALEKMVAFYNLTHREMNLDGIYGLRVLEGQLLLLLMEYDGREGTVVREATLAPEVVGRLRALHQQARNVSEWSLPHLAAQDNDYYRKLRPLVDKPFMVAHAYRLVEHTLRWTQTDKQRHEVPFDEEFSDGCMGELMGTGRTDHRACVVSPQCLEAMFLRGLQEYQITHQLLYTMLAEQVGCEDELDKWLFQHGWSGGLPQLHLEFCSNNFFEVQQQMSPLEGSIIPIYQDLFMEQEFVCPALGFMEFLHFDWLKQILDWQKPNGCFGRMPASDFGRAYKERQHLDYQYEGDTPSPDTPIIAGGRRVGSPPRQPHLNTLPPGGSQGRTGRGISTGVKGQMEVNSETAVIQQTHRLHLVGELSNQTRRHQIQVEVVSAGRGREQPGGGTERLEDGGHPNTVMKQAGHLDHSPHPAAHQDLDRSPHPAAHQDLDRSPHPAAHHDLDRSPHPAAHQDLDRSPHPAAHQDLDRSPHPAAHHDLDRSPHPAAHQDLDRSPHPAAHHDRRRRRARTGRNQVPPVEAGSRVAHTGGRGEGRGPSHKHRQGSRRARQKQEMSHREKGMVSFQHSQVVPQQQPQKVQLQQIEQLQTFLQPSAEQRTSLDRETVADNRNHRPSGGDLGGPRSNGVEPDPAEERRTEVGDEDSLRRQPDVRGAVLSLDAALPARRRLLVEKSLDDGCLSHKTAVAAGALSQYLRFLISPGTLEYRSRVSLGGENTIMRPPVPLMRRQRRKAQGAEHPGVNGFQQEPPGGRKQKHAVGRRPYPGLAAVKRKPQRPGRVAKVTGRKSANQVAESDIHVIPRPDPDDVIHSEHDDLQMVREYDDPDEDNHPQDYYDPEVDAETDSAATRQRLQPPRLNLNPKFRRNLPAQNLDLFNRRDNQGDQEYEQYIDDTEDDGGHDQGQNPIRPLDLIHPRVPSDKHTNPVAPDNQVEDNYNDYAGEGAADGMPRSPVRRRQSGPARSVGGVRRQTPHVARSEHSAEAGPGDDPQRGHHTGVQPPGRTYMVLATVMLLLLLFMYRFVKKRRIVIKYHRNTCR